KARALGKLEQSVMEVVWKNKNCLIREIVQTLQKKRSIAYTTVATILQRLFIKGLVGRKTEKNGYWYFPKISKDSYVKTLSKNFIKTLVNSFGDIAVSSFAESIENLPKEKKRYLLKILGRYESKH
ncbi:MAG: BlaI/MecI/CopY family transcriptional regulator, partial [Candidatus Roizmanbacteria bacterium]|nr:BlaI/MecI/CopY family transcriptional regulator [Candidatus Roizmanbacteria bacterium]